MPDGQVGEDRTESGGALRGPGTPAITAYSFIAGKAEQGNAGCRRRDQRLHYLVPTQGISLLGQVDPALPEMAHAAWSGRSTYVLRASLAISASAASNSGAR